MAEPSADVLVGGRDEPRWSPPPWLSSRWTRTAAAVLLVGTAVAFAAVMAEDDPQEPVGPASAEPALSVVGRAIAVSQGGVVVVPVALSNPGEALRVRSAEITAAPVRTPSLVTAPDVVPTRSTRRLAVIVDPDCTVIGPGIGGELVATVVVRVALASGGEQDLRLALGKAPAVRALLDRLCGGSGGRDPSLGDPDAAAVQDLLEQEASEVGLEVRMLDLGDGG